MRLLKNSFLILMVLLFLPLNLSAFCGFYVGGAGAEMFADATQVVLLRDGTTTVLSMQNRYEGPLEDFAMVVPVKEIIMKNQVKTLAPSLFEKIDTLSSPRLVEYWEDDPCYPENNGLEADFGGSSNNYYNNGSTNGAVVVQAQFEVGEYEISVLSTTEATALETWLTSNGFALPQGAATYLEPYVQSGDFFFAAKVNTSKVTFDSEGKAVLSPLRFNFDSEDFQLPIRLGMINSNGKQDLIVYILGNEQRYELKNYPNVTVPTNIQVVDAVRNDFAAFYRSIFSRTVKENPGAAITEYSWSASSCDPCPGPVTLTEEDFLTFGADVLPGDVYRDWVLTRIHLQYEKDQIGEDLIFKKADPIVGGRENYTEENKLETESQSSSFNAFQARYIIRHPWEGLVECEAPNFNIWGGIQTSSALSPNSVGGEVFGEEIEKIDELVIDNIPSIGLTAKGKPVVLDRPSGFGKNSGGTGDKKSASCSIMPGKGAIPFSLFFVLGFLFLRPFSKRK